MVSDKEGGCPASRSFLLSLHPDRNSGCLANLVS